MVFDYTGLIQSRWSWREGYLEGKVSLITPKTKLQRCYEHDYDSFLAVLKKNRRNLAHDPGRRCRGRRSGRNSRDRWQSCCP